MFTNCPLKNAVYPQLFCSFASLYLVLHRLTTSLPTINSIDLNNSSPSATLSRVHLPQILLNEILKVLIGTPGKVLNKVSGLRVDAKGRLGVGRVVDGRGGEGVGQVLVLARVQVGDANVIVSPLRASRAPRRHLPVRLVDKGAGGQDLVGGVWVGDWREVAATEEAWN